MANFNLMEHYNTAVAADAFYSASHSAVNDGRDHTSLHLSGIISVILGREISQVSEISADDVIRLNNSIRTENGAITNADSISADHLSALADISRALSSAMHPDGTALGIVDVNNEPVTLDMASYYGMEAEGYQPKRPGFFKRLLNRIFGAFKEECENYRQWEIISKRKEGIDQEAFAANTAKQSELSEQLSRQLSTPTADIALDADNHREPENIADRIRELADELLDIADSHNTEPAYTLLSQEAITKLYTQLSDIGNSEAKSAYFKLYKLSKGYTFEQLDSNQAQDEKVYQDFENELSVADYDTFAEQNGIAADSNEAKQRYQQYLLEKKQQMTELFTTTLSASLHDLEADIRTIDTKQRGRGHNSYNDKIKLCLEAGAACRKDADSLLELDSTNELLQNISDYANALQVYSVLEEYIEKRAAFAGKYSVNEYDFEAQKVVSLKAVSDKILNEFNAETATPADISIFLELSNQEMREYSTVPKPKINMVSENWMSVDEKLRSNPINALTSDALPSTHIKAMQKAVEKLNQKYGLESNVVQRQQTSFADLEQQEGIAVKTAPAVSKPEKLKGKELDTAISKQLDNYYKLDNKVSRAVNKLLPSNMGILTNITRNTSDIYDETVSVMSGLNDKEMKCDLVTLYLLSEGMEPDIIFDISASMQQKEELINKFVKDITILNAEKFAEETGIDIDTDHSKYDEYCRTREKEIMDMFSDKLAPTLHKMESVIGEIDINDPQTLVDNYRAIQLCTRCAETFRKSIEKTADVNRNTKLQEEISYAKDLNLYSIINTYTAQRSTVTSYDELEPEDAFYALVSKAGAELFVNKLDGQKLGEVDLTDDTITSLRTICDKGIDENQRLKNQMKKLGLKSMMTGMKNAVINNKDVSFLQQFFNDGTINKSVMESCLKSAQKSM